MEDLKRCPFCGRAPRIRGDENMGFYVKCIGYDKEMNQTCFVAPCTNLFSTAENAVKAWNQRAGAQTAHWIVRREGAYLQTRVYCSGCGKRSGIGGILENQIKPFCPNCGRPMSKDVQYG